MRSPVLCGWCFAVAAGSAIAQSPMPAQALLDDALSFNVGAFVVRSKVTASLNGQFADNPSVDFDRAFGRGSDATRLRGDAMWRITPQHHLRFMYFDNTVRRSKVLDQSIAWGDYRFDVGGQVDFTHKMKISELLYEYAFLRRPNYELAASLGVHYTDTSLKLAGAATVTDGNGQSSQVSAATRMNSVLALLPVAGLRGGWVVSPQWYLEAQGQYFNASHNGIRGNWSDLRLSGTWMVARHLGVGLGYNRFATHTELNRDGFDGQLKTSYSGLQLFLTGTF